jgi:broad specificity phosphatase PhoE
VTLIPLRPFCMIRHGQTDANRDGIISGTLDAMLTERGRAGAEALSHLDWPAPLAIFSSPQRRAHETAQLAFPGRIISLVEGLRERDWGIFEGRPLAEIPPRDSTPEAGEGWVEMQERVGQAVIWCMAQAGEAMPVMVAHSGVLRAVRALTGGDAHNAPVPNTTPCLFLPEGAGWREQGLAQAEAI